jgi:hypothetical protein
MNVNLLRGLSSRRLHPMNLYGTAMIYLHLEDFRDEAAKVYLL